MSESAKDRRWDVFISYASEDYEPVARPLARELMKLGVAVWFDRTELKIGDSLRQKIDEGLSKSRYGIVILSESFFAKHYTNLEISGLAQREFNGEHVILPIWYHVTAQEVRMYSPPLADRIALNWDSGITHIIASVVEKIRPDIVESVIKKFPTIEPLPRISTGKELVAIVQGAHLSNFFNEDPESPEELELISDFLQEVQDYADVLSDLGPGERLRAEYGLRAKLEEIETAGWFVYGSRARKKLRVGDVIDDWTVATIALTRGSDKQVYTLGDQIVVKNLNTEK